jgi:hypothetical protein
MLINPEIGMVRDLYEAVTGKDLFTGRQLSDEERTLAAISFIALGTINSISEAGRVLRTTNMLEAPRIAAAENVARQLRSDLNIRSASLGKGLTIEDIRDAAAVNAEIQTVHSLQRPGVVGQVVSELAAPFPNGTLVVKASFDRSIELSRVHGSQNLVGRFAVAGEDISGLTADAAGAVLNTPVRGTLVSTYRIPAGTQLWMGSINGGTWGISSNVRQFFIPAGVKAEWVTSTKVLQ